MSLNHINMSERRIYSRNPFGTEARLVLPDGPSWLARTLDIGVGGAAVVTDVNLPIGTALAIHMNLPARPKGTAPF